LKRDKHKKQAMVPIIKCVFGWEKKVRREK